MESPRDPFVQAILRFCRTLLAAAKSYVVNVTWKNESAGLKTLWQLGRGGPLNRLGLALLVACVGAIVYLSLQRQALPGLRVELWEGEALTIPALALPFSLVIQACAWSYLLISAASASLALYVIVAAYAAYFGILVGLALGRSPWVGLIPFWLLALGGWRASAQGERPSGRRLYLVWLIVPSLIAGLLGRVALGLNKLLPPTWGPYLLAAIFFALVSNPWAQRGRAFRPAIAFAMSVVVFGAFYAVCLIKLPWEEALGSAFLGFHGLLGLVGLFWYWVGLDLFDSAQDLADWLGDTIKELSPTSLLGVALFAFWILWAVGAYVLTRPLPIPLLDLLWQYKWGQDLLTAYMSWEPPLALAMALDLHLYLTLGMIGLGLIILLARRLSEDVMMALLGVTLLGFFILWGYFGLFLSFQSSESRFGFWPLLVFVVGIFWQVLKMSPGLVAGRARAWLFLGFLLLVGSIALVELVSGYPYFEWELTLNTFLGAIYLGVPYLLYTFLYRQQRYTPVSSQHLLLLFGLGMGTAFPALTSARLVIAPLFWLGIVLATVWRWGRWDDLWDGVVYLSAVAMGFATFYTHPLLVPLPAFTALGGRLLQIQEQYTEIRIWPWEARWWWLSLCAWGAGAVLGYLAARSHKAQGAARVGLLALGLGLGVALMALGEFAIGQAG